MQHLSLKQLPRGHAAIFPNVSFWGKQTVCDKHAKYSVAQ